MKALKHYSCILQTFFNQHNRPKRSPLTYLEIPFVDLKIVITTNMGVKPIYSWIWHVIWVQCHLGDKWLYFMNNGVRYHTHLQNISYTTTDDTETDNITNLSAYMAGKSFISTVGWGAPLYKFFSKLIAVFKTIRNVCSLFRYIVSVTYQIQQILFSKIINNNYNCVVNLSLYRTRNYQNSFSQFCLLLL